MVVAFDTGLTWKEFAKKILEEEGRRELINIAYERHLSNLEHDRRELMQIEQEQHLLEEEDEI